MILYYSDGHLTTISSTYNNENNENTNIINDNNNNNVYIYIYNFGKVLVMLLAINKHIYCQRGEIECVYCLI